MTITTIISLIALIVSLFCTIYAHAFKSGTYVKRLERVESEVQRISSELTKQHDSMIQMSTVMRIKIKGVENIFSDKFSPRRLNALGQKLFFDMNGTAFISSNKAKLFSAIDEMAPKTALDVEFSALAAVTGTINDNIFNPIKRFIYNCPLQVQESGEKVEITIDDACFILSIPLRDAYLDLHPELQ